MTEIILYNYALSPYSEKIRLMLGYAGLPWHSVTIAAMPPRPALEALAGGYRKIPVAQIGADVFCDTQIIAEEIAKLADKPALYLHNCSPEAQAFANHADTQVFMACVAAAGPGLVGLVLKETSLTDTLRFVKDRIGIAGKAKVKPIAGKRAKALISEHISNMESLLDKPFLFGDTPCAADFSAFHSLWLFCEKVGKPWLEQAPRVAVWYARMRAFGHGTATAMTADAALDVALNAQPAAIADTADLRPVSIAPQDYARDPVAGLLAGETQHRWILQRAHDRVGSVHVHFPKAGFGLRG